MAVVLVTGSKGQLGQEIFSLHTRFPQHRFYFADRQELDISDGAAVDKKFKIIQPQYCINCAAYTAVDKAETENDRAFAINALGAKNLAESSAAADATLIHVSTDYVFDGAGEEPYKEDHAIDPINIYGASKAAGEAASMEANKDTVIIRTSWVYSEYGNNFVKTMLRLMESRESINVVADQWGSPTYAADLAAAILHIIERGKSVPGIYHYSNKGAINWYDFAKKIGEFSGSACVVYPINTEQYPTPARRPKYSVMDTAKISAVLGVPILNWEDSLARCLERLRISS